MVNKILASPLALIGAGVGAAGGCVHDRNQRHQEDADRLGPGDGRGGRH
jgi:hypothetical protein